jgi:beta-ketodecanoyl-[acyl-carrier-protein] synthase
VTAQDNQRAHAAPHPSKIRTFITGTGLFVPPNKITNAELVSAFNAYAQMMNEKKPDQPPLQLSSEAFIEKASGIKQRYVMEKRGILDPEVMHPLIDERSDDAQSLQCEIAVSAGQEALDQAGISADQVDAVIVACSNLQRAYPAVAVEVQAALGARGFAYDMNVACSSATFGIQAACNAIQSGQAQSVLVISPEITSAHLEWRDRDCHFIFGDVCTAVLLQAESVMAPQAAAFEVISSQLATKFSNNIRNNFGFMNRCDPAGLSARDKTFYQQGRKVFKEVVPMVSEQLLGHMDTERLVAADISRLWLHQANLSMNQLIAQRVLGREVQISEAPVILDEFANTSSAGSIIAFHRHRADLAPNAYGFLCSFGAGYSIGSVLVRKC